MFAGNDICWFGVILLNKKVVSIVFSLALLLFFVAVPRGYAAVPSDFSYRGIALGDSYEKVQAKMGEPLYTDDSSIHGVRVTKYEYDDLTVICVSKYTGKVVDIVVKGDSFTIVEGIAYGATPYAIKQHYGKAVPQRIDGDTVLIYTNPDDKWQRLLLKVDNTQGYLKSAHWTSCPISIEEEDFFIEGMDKDEPIKIEWDIPKKKK